MSMKHALQLTFLMVLIFTPFAWTRGAGAERTGRPAGRAATRAHPTQEPQGPDRDGDGIPDTMHTLEDLRTVPGALDDEDGFFPEKGARCEPVTSVFAPYCHYGMGSGLTFRPAAGGDPDLLAFLTQTAMADDIVWLDASDLSTEYARCCPANNITVGAMAYNSAIGCSGFDTVFVANTTSGSGSIIELSMFGPGSPTSARKCLMERTGDDEDEDEEGDEGVDGDPSAFPAWIIDNGEDEIACLSLSSCQTLRQFTFDGLNFGDRVEALAVVTPPDGRRPFLAVSATDVFMENGTLYFVNPESPSCASMKADVLGSCQVFDGADLVNVTGMAWVEGYELAVASRDTGRLYRIDVTGYGCDILASCDAPGAGKINGIAFDPAANLLYLVDDETNEIFEMAPF